MRRRPWHKNNELGDLSDEGWFWRNVLPWAEHFNFVVIVGFCVYTAWDVFHGELWPWAVFHGALAWALIWVNRVRHRRSRKMRHRQYELNAMYQIEAIDGQEGP